MNKIVTASAPGKLVLSGEYAVLDGAPAICMAINRRARAAVVDIAGKISEVSVSGYSNETCQFQVSGERLQWLDEREPVGVVDSVWRAANFAQSSGREINLDSTEFFDTMTQRKIGIGSSAAITVALCAATHNSANIDVLTPLAQRAHSNLQAGAGSGADIACSLHGGVIEYRMAGTSVVPLSWPEDLAYRLLWTGVAASTRDKLAQLDASVSKPSRARLADASEAIATAWKSSDAQQIIAGYRDYCEHLHEFSSDHDLGIFDAGHEELWRAANVAGLTCKPCGAGGGDVGVLFGLDEAELDGFTDSQSNLCSVIDCEISVSGVRIEA